MAKAKLIQGLTQSQIKQYKQQLNKLLALPIVKQKSPEWYAMRENMITASDFAQALGEGKFGTQKDLIKKKSLPPDVNAWKSGSNMFFKWGNLFEPVANDLYSIMHDVKVHEFGLIKHHTYDFFGASPDGISDVGIMVEIKCPFKRKIIKDGDVPTQYYYQIQGQLDVCNLDVCDYFECEFERIKSEELLELDDEVHGARYRGVLIDCCTDDNNDVVYSPIIKPGLPAYADLTSWVKNQDKDGNVIYWSLAIFNEKRVVKDQKWVNEKLLELEKVWQKILYYRANRDKIEFELDRVMTISTEEAFPKSVCKHSGFKGYAFQDIDEE